MLPQALQHWTSDHAMEKQSQCTRLQHLTLPGNGYWLHRLWHCWKYDNLTSRGYFLDRSFVRVDNRQSFLCTGGNVFCGVGTRRDPLKTEPGLSGDISEHNYHRCTFLIVCKHVYRSRHWPITSSRLRNSIFFHKIIQHCVELSALLIYDTRFHWYSGYSAQTNYKIKDACPI